MTDQDGGGNLQTSNSNWICQIWAILMYIHMYNWEFSKSKHRRKKILIKIIVNNMGHSMLLMTLSWLCHVMVMILTMTWPWRVQIWEFPCTLQECKVRSSISSFWSRGYSRCNIPFRDIDWVISIWKTIGLQCSYMNINVMTFLSFFKLVISVPKNPRSQNFA